MTVPFRSGFCGKYRRGGTSVLEPSRRSAAPCPVPFCARADFAHREFETNNRKHPGTQAVRSNSHGLRRAQTSPGRHAGLFSIVCKFPFAQEALAQNGTGQGTADWQLGFQNRHAGSAVSSRKSLKDICYSVIGVSRITSEPLTAERAVVLKFSIRSAAP